MRALSALTLALAVSCSSGLISCRAPHARIGSVSGDFVTIGDEVRHVGEVRTHKSEQVASVKMLLESPGEKPKGVIVESIERETRRDEVLAVEDGAPKKLRVTYLEKTKSNTANGQSKVVTYTVVGKVFLVDRLVGRTVITHEDGTPLGIGEEEIVASDYKTKSPGTEQIEAELRKPLRIGEKVDALAALLRRTMPTTIEKAKIEVVLTGVRDNAAGPVAVFSVAIDAVGPDGDIEVGMSLKGELLVRIADCADVSSDISGDLAMLRPLQANTSATPDTPAKPSIKGAGHIRFTERTDL